jgi:hypothetical protein
MDGHGNHAGARPTRSCDLASTNCCRPRSLLCMGPGCPVCVTPVAMIDRAIVLATRPEVILCSYGDMLRVPGSRGDLFAAKAAGGDVRMVYSPLDASSWPKHTPIARWYSLRWALKPPRRFTRWPWRAPSGGPCQFQPLGFPGSWCPRPCPHPVRPGMPGAGVPSPPAMCAP